MKWSISIKAVLSLLPVALAAMSLLWMFSSFLAQVEQLSPLTTTAGRQHDLSMQLRRYANMVHIGQQEDREQLRLFVHHFDLSLQALRNGGPLPTLPTRLPAPPEAVIPALNAVYRLWLPLKSRLLSIADLPEREKLAQELWQRADADLQKLAVASQAVVNDLEIYDGELHRHMGRMLKLNVLLILLMLAGAFWLSRRFVVAPLVRLAEVSSALAGGDYSQRMRVHGNDELTVLMRAFNHMAEAITGFIDREHRASLRNKDIAEAVISLSRELAGEAVLRYVGNTCMRILDARYCMLSYLVDGQKQFLPLGMSDVTLEQLQDHPPQGLGQLGRIWNEREIVRVDNLAALPDRYGFPEGHPPMCSFLGAPLEFSGQIIGALYLCDRKDGQPFSEADENYVRMLASACAVALANTQHLEQLQKSNQHLEQRVEERTREIRESNRQLHNREIELEMMNGELRQANAAKDEFLANTSHELRTPLNSIIGFSDLLLENKASDKTTKEYGFLKHINTGGKRLLSLINCLLDLSKIESGMLEVHEETGNPAVVLDYTVSQLAQLAAEKQLQIDQVIPDGECIVTMDTGKLQQVWTNLIGNAIKFTPPGGWVKAGFSVSDAAEGSVLKGYVQDSGIGINSDEAERIFEPFVQAEGGLTREFEGTGLGLSLVRSLLELQGGDIHVKSTPGSGSCFVFSLPVHKFSASEQAEIISADGLAKKEDAANLATAGAGLMASPDVARAIPHILIVDDESARAAAVVTMLQEEGYRGVICDLEQLGQRVEETCPILIMLGVSGEPTNITARMQRLHACKVTREIPLILLGGAHDTPYFSLDSLDKRMNRIELIDRISSQGRYLPQSAVMKVLVVDDDSAVRDYLRETLTGQGYSTLFASNGRACIQAAIQHDPDLIILDLMMPSMSGFDVLDELKQHPTASDIPVVVYTAKELLHGEMMRLGHEVEKILTKGVTGHAALVRELRSLELLYPVQARLIDSVLRCYNLRYLQLRLEQECSRAEHHGDLFSLVSWEMDGFDEYLNQHGWRWAIEALRELVQLVDSFIHRKGVLVRTGEAVFVLILPDSSHAEVEQVAEQIRLRIRKYEFPLAAGKTGHFTASCSCAHYKGSDNSTSDRLLARLHDRRALARQSGGDVGVFHDQEPDRK